MNYNYIGGGLAAALGLASIIFGTYILTERHVLSTTYRSSKAVMKAAKEMCSPSKAVVLNPLFAGQCFTLGFTVMKVESLAANGYHVIALDYRCDYRDKNKCVMFNSNCTSPESWSGVNIISSNWTPSVSSSSGKCAPPAPRRFCSTRWQSAMGSRWDTRG